MSTRSRPTSLLVLAAAVTLAIFALATSGGPSQVVGPLGEAQDRVEQTVRDGPGSRAPTGSEPAESGPGVPESTREHRQDPVTHQALRERILAADRARAAVRPPPAPEPAAPPEPGGLTDRTDGSHPELVELLNADFLPLADECIAAAREANPELSGMLAMGLETVADEDLGSIVEQVDFPERNEVDDPELQTCLRETALSMILPPATSGRAALLITLEVGEPRSH